ncbi:unnamed protein product [Miscanthus lutarioriparius]|uniref:ATP synthase subunit e, mitochondrial n=1 Tax=Miscanthus lutarioriparius TaxID=422564 RepID=A0A811R1J5_9POAL|nr:unnamed protein product [Miscanthus lutarioriparius]
MPFTPGPYSGVSTLALVARASAFGVGVVYGSIKLSILKATKPKRRKHMLITKDNRAATC